MAAIATTSSSRTLVYDTASLGSTPAHREGTIASADATSSVSPSPSAFSSSTPTLLSLALKTTPDDETPCILMPRHGSENSRYLDAFAKVGARIIPVDYKSAIEFEKAREELAKIFSRSAYTHDCSMSQSIIEAAGERLSNNEFRYKNLQGLKHLASELVRHHHAVLLAGGVSVHPSFYGETDREGESIGYYDPDPRRTLLELFLIHACRYQGKPLLGICRGHQLINVYYGGTLHRRRIGEFQLARIRKIDPESSLSQSIPLPGSVFFNHRQSVAALGRGLRAFGNLTTSDSYAEERRKLERAIEEASATASGDADFFREIGALPILEQAQELVRNEEVYRAKIEEVMAYLVSPEFVVGVESNESPTIVGVQFHPEAVVALETGAKEADLEGNTRLLEVFVSLAKVSMVKNRIFQAREAK